MGVVIQPSNAGNGRTAGVVKDCERTGVGKLIDESILAAKLPLAGQLWTFRADGPFHCSSRTPRFRCVRPTQGRGLLVKVMPGDTSTSMKGTLVVPPALNFDAVFTALAALHQGADEDDGNEQSGDAGKELMSKVSDPGLPVKPLTPYEEIAQGVAGLRNIMEGTERLRTMEVDLGTLVAQRAALDQKIDELREAQARVLASFNEQPLYKALEAIEAAKASLSSKAAALPAK